MTSFCDDDGLSSVLFAAAGLETFVFKAKLFDLNIISIFLIIIVKVDDDDDGNVTALV
jgi:hypothetical protein